MQKWRRSRPPQHQFCPRSAGVHLLGKLRSLSAPTVDTRAFKQLFSTSSVLACCVPASGYAPLRGHIVNISLPEPVGLELNDIRRDFGDNNGLHSTSVNIAPGEFVYLLEPYGCGKYTMLRSLADISPPHDDTSS